MPEDDVNSVPTPPQNPENQGETVDSQEVPVPQVEQQKIAMSDRLGELEVERVEASDELERIRNQSAQQVQSQTQTEEEAPQQKDAFGDDGAGLKELLKEANLSPRHLKFCCGGILVIVLLVAMGYGVVKLMNWWGSRPDPVPVEEEVPAPEEDPDEEVPEVPDDGVPYQEVGGELKNSDASIYTALILGENQIEKDPALDAGEDLGEEVVSEESLTQSILNFAEVYQALQVDVQALLDQSQDRRQTLADYVNELKFLRYQGGQELESLKGITDTLATQFAEAEAEKDLFEARFFERLSNLDAYGASAALNEFTVRGEEVVNLRAEYLARQKLVEYYELILDDMDRRITDIEFNEEALVKGVQVVEIENSDIDLIIQEDEL